MLHRTSNLDMPLGSSLTTRVKESDLKLAEPAPFATEWRPPALPKSDNVAPTGAFDLLALAG